MRFSDEAWRQTAKLRKAIHRLPSNTELAAGTLSPERFRFYILQDALYLGQYATVLAAPNNRYQAWIDPYADEAFGAAVARVIGTADGAAAAHAQLRPAMLGAFHRSTQYEYLFWDGAYRMRAWPSVGRSEE